MPGRSRVQGRGNQPKGIASWSAGQPPEPSGQQGTRLLRCGRMPRPTGGSPPGAALPPVGCPAPAGRRYRLQRAHSDRASARRPGRRSDAGRASRRGKPRDRIGAPRIVRGGPSSVKGTRRSFLTAPQKGSSGPTLQRLSLCHLSGPDGEGQARGQARSARLCTIASLHVEKGTPHVWDELQAARNGRSPARCSVRPVLLRIAESAARA